MQKGPSLAETAETIMHIVTGFGAEDAILQSSSHVHHLYEGLFSHFFSTHRISYSSQDCEWFLELANKNVQWIMNTKAQTFASPDSSGCVSISVYKLYLTRILGKAEVGTAGINTSKSLTLYKQWVSLGIHIFDSHFGRNDISTTFWIVGMIQTVSNSHILF